MFREAHKEDLVLVIEEDIITNSEPEDKMSVNLVPDKGERVRPNEFFEWLSEFMYLKKYADKDTSAYGILLKALKNIDTSYNPKIQKMH